MAASTSPQTQTIAEKLSGFSCREAEALRLRTGEYRALPPPRKPRAAPHPRAPRDHASVARLPPRPRPHCIQTTAIKSPAVTNRAAQVTAPCVRGARAAAHCYRDAAAVRRARIDRGILAARGFSVDLRGLGIQVSKPPSSPFYSGFCCRGRAALSAHAFFLFTASLANGGT